jgi:hypothetical protein
LFVDQGLLAIFAFLGCSAFLFALGTQLAEFFDGSIEPGFLVFQLMRQPATFFALIGKLPAAFGETMLGVVDLGHLERQLIAELLDVGEDVVHQAIERRKLVTQLRRHRAQRGGNGQNIGVRHDRPSED